MRVWLEAFRRAKVGWTATRRQFGFSENWHRLESTSALEAETLFLTSSGFACVRRCHAQQSCRDMNTLRIRTFVWCLAFVGVLVPSISQAQYMINMSLVTCSQYLALPPDQSRIFSAWMSGWFNQKTGYTYINLEAYARNVQNVKAWCASNPGELVMTGLQRATAK